MIRVVGSSTSLGAPYGFNCSLFVTGLPAWAESMERVEQVERVDAGKRAHGGDRTTALPPADVSEQYIAPDWRAAVRL